MHYNFTSLRHEHAKLKLVFCANHKYCCRGGPSSNQVMVDRTLLSGIRSCNHHLEIAKALSVSSNLRHPHCFHLS